MGQPDLGRLDEPGAHVRSRSRRRDFTDYWVYVAGPLLGVVIAVGAAFVLRGRGGGRAGSSAAQGELDTEINRPDQN